MRKGTLISILVEIFFIYVVFGAPRAVETTVLKKLFFNATEILDNLLSDYNRDQRPNQKGLENL